MEALVRHAADELAALGFVYEAAVARLDLAELTAGEVDALGEALRVLERLADPLRPGGITTGDAGRPAVLGVGV